MRQDLLTYEEYTNFSMSSPVSESQFSRFLTKAYLKLNRMCSNRLSTIEEIPEEVKYTLTEFINIINATNDQSALNLSSYSNGIETFGYNVDQNNPEKSINSIMYHKARENLSENEELSQLLLYRGLD